MAAMPIVWQLSERFDAPVMLTDFFDDPESR